MNKERLHDILTGDSLEYVFRLLKANGLRARQTMAVVLGRTEKRSDPLMRKKLTDSLRQILRDKDVLFQTDNELEWGLLLPQSAVEEACGFLRRFFNEAENMGAELFVRAAVMEIYHPEQTLERVLADCREALEKAGNGETVTVVPASFDRPVIQIKMSIVDGDPLFRDLLLMVVERLDISGIELQIRTFDDGLALMDSGWASSWHPHIVVLSDVLPRKNGMDVLHELRDMPSEEKFTVLMMTRRNSEEDMIYAYESGTDGYLVKPFNIRLFEAQLKRILLRVWT